MCGAPWPESRALHRRIIRLIYFIIRGVCKRMTHFPLLRRVFAPSCAVWPRCRRRWAEQSCIRDPDWRDSSSTMGCAVKTPHSAFPRQLEHGHEGGAPTRHTGPLLRRAQPAPVRRGCTDVLSCESPLHSCAPGMSKTPCDFVPGPDPHQGPR